MTTTDSLRKAQNAVRRGASHMPRARAEVRIATALVFALTGARAHAQATPSSRAVECVLAGLSEEMRVHVLQVAAAPEVSERAAPPLAASIERTEFDEFRLRANEYRHSVHAMADRERARAAANRPRLRDDERRARDVERAAAITHHREASALRTTALAQRRCAGGTPVADQCEPARTRRDRERLEAAAVAALQRAGFEYSAAIAGYDAFVRAYPDDAMAIEIAYDRADALFWSGRYADAAAAYGVVRDAGAEYEIPAAFMAVRAREAAVRELALQRQLDACVAVRAGVPASELVDPANGQLLIDAAAERSCTALPTTAVADRANAPAVIAPIEIPSAVADWISARLAYLIHVARHDDTAAVLHAVFVSDPGHPDESPPFRAKFRYVNARTWLRFGHVAEAERELRALLFVGCVSDSAPTVLEAAFADLRNLLLATQRALQVETFANDLSHSMCPASSDLWNPLDAGVFQRALSAWHEAEAADAADSTALYERAAIGMLITAMRHPDHPRVPLAMFYVALGEERAGLDRTAAHTYRCISEHFAALRPNGSRVPGLLDGNDLQERVDILEISSLRTGITLEHALEFEAALAAYTETVANPAFSTARERRMHVHDALAGIASIHHRFGHWPQARAAWQRFLPYAEPGRERALVDFRLADSAYQSGDWATAVRELDRYRRRARSDGASLRMGPDAAAYDALVADHLAQAQLRLRQRRAQRGPR